ncbi:MAG: LPP20 family lipoprotein [bacterium]
MVRENNGPPDWIHTRGENLYPSARYLTGIGMAADNGDPVSDMQAADRSAFSELSNRIIAHVSSQVTTNMVEIVKNQTTEYSNKTAANIVIASSITVSGLTIARRYHDKDNKLYYSLAVLDRITASNQFREGLTVNKNEYDKALTNAQAFLREGRIADAISNFKQAFHSAMFYNQDYLYYRVIKGNTYAITSDFPEQLSQNDVITKVSDVLAGLKLVKIEGDNQAGLIGKPLSNPLKIKAIITGHAETPASGLNIEFKFVNGSGDMDAMARTDEKGEAGINVYKLGNSDTGTYSISAVPDFREFIDPSEAYKQWNDVFAGSKNKVLFTITLKKASIPWKIMLLINGFGDPTAIDMLSTELTQAGFNPFIGRDQELMRKCDVVVTVKIDAKFLSSYGGIHVFTASGNIKATSPQTGNVIAEESVSNVRGFGITDDRARNDAIQNAMKKMAESFVNKLLEND